MRWCGARRVCVPQGRPVIDPCNGRAYIKKELGTGATGTADAEREPAGGVLAEGRSSQVTQALPALASAGGGLTESGGDAQHGALLASAPSGVGLSEGSSCDVAAALPAAAPAAEFARPAALRSVTQRARDGADSSDRRWRSSLCPAASRKVPTLGGVTVAPRRVRIVRRW